MFREGEGDFTDHFHDVMQMQLVLINIFRRVNR